MASGILEDNFSGLGLEGPSLGLGILASTNRRLVSVSTNYTLHAAIRKLPAAGNKAQRLVSQDQREHVAMPTRALIASHVQTAVQKNGLERRIAEDAVLTPVVLKVRIAATYDTKNEPSKFGFLSDNNTTTVLLPLYRSNCVSQHSQLRTGGLCWSKVLLPVCLYCWQLAQ